MIQIPELEPRCNSWIVVSKATGEPVFETFDRATLERLNPDRAEVYTTLQWLQKFNASVKA